MIRFAMSCLQVVLAAGMLWMPAASAQHFMPRRHPPPNVLPRPGCDFNGNCLSVIGDYLRVQHMGFTLFALKIPGSAPGVWHLGTASPVSAGDKIEVELGDSSGNASIIVNYCPKSGVCADKIYRSPQAYEQLDIGMHVAAEHARVRAGRELPLLESRLIEGSWHGHRAYEYSYAYSGSIDSAGQKEFPDRRRRDVVMIPMQGGLLIADFRTQESLFTTEAEAFRQVLDSLTLVGRALPVAADARTVPSLPALRHAEATQGARSAPGAKGRP